MLQEITKSLSDKVAQLQKQNKWYWVPLVAVLQLLLILLAYATIKWALSTRDDTAPVPALNTQEQETSLNTLHTSQAAIQTNVAAAEHTLAADQAATATEVSAVRNDTDWDALDTRNQQGR